MVGTRWLYPAMGAIPIGLRWEAIYPLMDRMGLTDERWSDLHVELMLMENKAIATMVEFDKTKKKE